MANTYVRYVLFCAARNVPLGTRPDCVRFFDFEDSNLATATAAGEEWLTRIGLDHPWWALFGQALNGQLSRLAGEDT